METLSILHCARYAIASSLRGGSYIYIYHLSFLAEDDEGK